jgi:hypothetical protein
MSAAQSAHAGADAPNIATAAAALSRLVRFIVSSRILWCMVEMFQV